MATKTVRLSQAKGYLSALRVFVREEYYCGSAKYLAAMWLLSAFERLIMDQCITAERFAMRAHLATVNITSNYNGVD